jgi:TolB protein
MDGDWEIYAIDLASTILRRLTFSPMLDSYPRWSPDGEKIAFTSMRDGDMDIWLMRPDGEIIANLTGDNPLDDAVPHWSPDGNRIAYQVEGEHGNWEIGVLDLVTGVTRQITQGTAWSAQPAWYPVDSRVGIRTHTDLTLVWGSMKNN